jgi:hypothetical protein
MRAFVVSLVLATGCVTLRPVEVTHDFHAPPAQVQAAAETAARRMGWSGPVSPADHLTLTDTPQPRQYPLELLTTDEGTLHAQTRVPEGSTADQTALQPAAGLLIQATQQVLDPADVSPRAHAVESRSLPLTLALDLLLPEVGGIYALRGDPDHQDGAPRSWKLNLLLTSLMDFCGVMDLALGMSVRKYDRPGATPLLAAGVLSLVANRLFSVIADGTAVTARNRLSASGFVFDLTDLPLPHEVR